MSESKDMIVTKGAAYVAVAVYIAVLIVALGRAEAQADPSAPQLLEPVAQASAFEDDDETIVEIRFAQPQEFTLYLRVTDDDVIRIKWDDIRLPGVYSATAEVVDDVGRIACAPRWILPERDVCFGDLDDNGVRDVNDLSELLKLVGTDCP